MLTLLLTASVVGNSSHAQELVLDPDCPAPQQAIRVQVFPGGSIETIGQALSVEMRNNEVRITLVISQGTIGVRPPAQPFEISIGPFTAGTYVINIVGREVGGPEVPVASRQFRVEDNPPACTSASIMLISPAYQDVVLQQPFAAPIAVRVLDAQSRPVPGVRVFFDRLGPESIESNPQAPEVAFAQSQVQSIAFTMVGQMPAIAIRRARR